MAMDPQGPASPFSTLTEHRVPQEVQELIVDRLSLDPRALIACSLVCRQWYPRTRVHLFKRLQLGPLLPDVDEGSDFLIRNILRTSPHLGQYILHLEIHCVISDRPAAEWMIDLLPLFTCLKSIYVIGFSKLDSPARIGAWADNADPKLLIALCDLMALPSVESVTLHHIARFPLSHLIPHFHHIKSLELLACSPARWEHHGLFPLAAEGCPPRWKGLRRLSVAYSPTSLEVLLKAADTPFSPVLDLQELEIDVFHWNFINMDDSWNKFVNLRGTSIQRVTISQVSMSLNWVTSSNPSFASAYNIPRAVANFAPFPGLKELRLKLVLSPWQFGSQPHPLLSIVEGLRNLSKTQSQLREVSMELHSFDYEREGGSSLDDDDVWSAFDDLVCRDGLDVGRVTVFLPCNEDKRFFSSNLLERSAEDWGRMKLHAIECVGKALKNASSQGRLRIIFSLLGDG
ncbi:hypothetical protein BKA70DRAFT_1249262, partial [Coprinopsis sp. MPI-PUGE-AT-0042]